MLTQDIRHTFRAWRRTPVLALTAVATLSLGVGANAAVFSVVNAVLFRPLPYPAPERLIELFEANPGTVGATTRASALNYLTWSARTKTLEAIATFQANDFNVTGGTDVERVPGSSVAASLFRVLAVAPIAGRELRPADETPGNPSVALVAESLWKRRYGGDPAIIGKTITLNGEPQEIIGVVPDTFRDVGRSQISSVAGPQLFVPLRIDPARENRGNRTLRVVGRLRPGVSLEQARAEMSAIAAAMGLEFPSSNKGWGINLVRVDDSMFDEGVRPSLLALLGAVAVVMLIACANVSNLMLAKAIGRQRELALRTALGANRGRLVHQLLTESVVLAVVSGVIGMGVSFATVAALRPLLPETLPRITEVRVDLAVVAFGLLVSIGSAVLFGILPAIRVSRVDPLGALMQGGRGVAGSSRSVLRQGLVGAQVALATMLLVGGALLLQSFVRLHRVPLGFEPTGVLTVRIGLPRSAYPDGPRMSLFYQQLIQSLENDPEVEAAAVATSAPFTPGVRAGAIVADRAAAAATQSVVEHFVSEDYFRTLAIPIVAGRAFDERDRARSPTVAIVSQAVARQLWPDMNPIGQQLDRGGRSVRSRGCGGRCSRRRRPWTARRRTRSSAARGHVPLGDAIPAEDDDGVASHNARAIVARPAATRGPARERSGDSDAPGAHTRRLAGRYGRKPSTHDDARGSVCRDCRTPCGNRHLWCGGLFGRSTHAGDWTADGRGRHEESSPGARAARWAGVGSDRYGAWFGRGVCVEPPSGHLAVSGAARRSAHVRVCRDAARRCLAHRVLWTGPTRRAC